MPANRPGAARDGSRRGRPRRSRRWRPRAAFDRPGSHGRPHRRHRRRPARRSTWYLAVGSGGVWKTENAGVTWTPIFDDQPSYSIGCVALDPSTPGHRLGRHRRERQRPPRRLGRRRLQEPRRWQELGSGWGSRPRSTSARSSSIRETATWSTSPPRARSGARRRARPLQDLDGGATWERVLADRRRHRHHRRRLRSA